MKLYRALKPILLSIIPILSLSCSSVPSQEEVLSLIKTEIQKSETLENNLSTIVKEAPARLSGTKNNESAVEYWQHALLQYGVDSIWTQEVSVPNWTPGETFVYLNLPENGRQLLTSIPLGTSAGTNGRSITASVVEIRTREQLEKTKVKGKIVFFNMVMDDSVNTYGKAGWQRISGPSAASEKGAVAAIVRSVTTVLDNNPHTGVTRFEEGVKPIPAIAISTLSANTLSSAIAKNSNRKITLRSTSKMNSDAVGKNIIAEIRGAKNPAAIILISAHIDSWFNSQCANDNAAGCTQAVEILKTFAQLRNSGVKLNNTLRIILYQDEEMYLSGMKQYASIFNKQIDSAEPIEKGLPSQRAVPYIPTIEEQYHLFDIELDSGAGLPHSIIMFEPKEKTELLNKEFTPYLSKEYGFNSFISVGDKSHSDWPLTEADGAALYYFRADTPNYFHLHHSSLDNIETINFDNFKKATAALASFIYLMDSKL